MNNNRNMICYCKKHDATDDFSCRQPQKLDNNPSKPAPSR